jgi:aerobic carbon-monoxide dehydrogenase large subunit
VTAETTTAPDPGIVGRRQKRNEDPRLLTGKALFIDDLNLPDMAHVAFLRSPHAHARIRGIDASGALAMPGVVEVYTAADLGDYWQPGPLLVPPPPVEGMVFHQRCQVPLAKDKVRQLGEPVAVVVAENRYLAEDAAERILVDYDASWSTTSRCRRWSISKRPCKPERR